jgi:AcrR family transcriptional regulator
MAIPLPSDEQRSAGHRERKKQRTREKLVDAALRLFMERGYEATRIDDIVAEVELVPRTFFRYFCSKDDALFGFYDSIRNEARAALKARPRGEGMVRALVAAQLEMARAHRAHERVSLLLNQLVERSPDLRARRAAWRHDLQNDVAQALARRLPASAALVAAMITGAVYAAFSKDVDQWTTDGARRPLLEYWDATAAKVLKLFDTIDRRYTLR